MIDLKTWVLAILGALAAAPALASSTDDHRAKASASASIARESTGSGEDGDKDPTANPGSGARDAGAQASPAAATAPRATGTQPGRALPLPRLGKGELERSVQCLALNVYHEARSEPEQGQHAVAAVTLNRVASAAFPDSVCKVVKQGGKKRNQCQFSWWCDRYPDEPKEAGAWSRALELARKALAGGLKDPTNGALYYHATRVKPRWARVFEHTGKIGQHLFYKPQGV